MNLEQFKSLTKQSSKSYHQQKAFIQSVLSGKIDKCPQCKQKLLINMESEPEVSGIFCQQKCTDIALDFDNP